MYVELDSRDVDFYTIWIVLWATFAILHKNNMNQERKNKKMNKEVGMLLPKKS